MPFSKSSTETTWNGRRCNPGVSRVIFRTTRGKAVQWRVSAGGPHLFELFFQWSYETHVRRGSSGYHATRHRSCSQGYTGVWICPGTRSESSSSLKAQVQQSCSTLFIGGLVIGCVDGWVSSKAIRGQLRGNWYHLHSGPIWSLWQPLRSIRDKCIKVIWDNSSLAGVKLQRIGLFDPF
jgi:hypothetical protein